MLSILHEIATRTKYVPPEPKDENNKQPTATLTGKGNLKFQICTHKLI